jgi:hypothetical protein
VAVSTCSPTCEQLLAARGQVLGYPGVALVVVACRQTLVMWPLAPTIHPASSGSQWWWWVLCWLVSGFVVELWVGMGG